MNETPLQALHRILLRFHTLMEDRPEDLHELVDAVIRDSVASADLVTTAEAARIIGVSQARVWAWAKEGRLVPAVHVSGRPAFYRTDVEQFAQTGRRVPYRPRKTDTER